MSKPAILLDLDYTLLDGAKIKKSIFHTACGDAPHSKALLLYKESKRSGLFSLTAFAAALGLGRSGKKLEEIRSLFKKPRAYNYPGSEMFLKTLRTRKYDLYLISYGDKAFQRLKIHQSALANYFKEIFTTEEFSKEKVLRGLKRRGVRPAIVLDDSLEALATARRLGFGCLRVKRGAKDSRYYSDLLSRVKSILEGNRQVL